MEGDQGFLLFQMAKSQGHPERPGQGLRSPQAGGDSFSRNFGRKYVKLVIGTAKCKIPTIHCCQGVPGVQQPCCSTEAASGLGWCGSVGC